MPRSRQNPQYGKTWSDNRRKRRTSTQGPDRVIKRLFEGAEEIPEEEVRATQFVRGGGVIHRPAPRLSREPEGEVVEMKLDRSHGVIETFLPGEHGNRKKLRKLHKTSENHEAPVTVQNSFSIRQKEQMDRIRVGDRLIIVRNGEILKEIRGREEAEKAYNRYRRNVRLVNLSDNGRTLLSK